MLGFIRRWWRRRHRNYRCDGCGARQTRSVDRAYVRVERTMIPTVGKAHTSGSILAAIRRTGGWRVRLLCPTCAAKEKQEAAARLKDVV